MSFTCVYALLVDTRWRLSAEELTFVHFRCGDRPAVVTDDGFLRYNKKKNTSNKYVVTLMCTVVCALCAVLYSGCLY